MPHRPTQKDTLRPDEQRAIFSAMHAALKDVFPADYHSRCYYVAVVIASHLQLIGLHPRIVGGCAVMVQARKNGIVATHGFSHSNLSDMPPHMWIETDTYPIIDLCHMYDAEAEEDCVPVYSRPAVWWSEPKLPVWLTGYHKTRRFQKMEFSGEAGATMCQLEESFKTHLDSPSFTMPFFARTQAGVDRAMRKGDLWLRSIAPNEQALRSNVAKRLASFKTVPIQTTVGYLHKPDESIR